MWNTPTNSKLSSIPRIYETESTPLAEKLVHLHFFIGGCDWYIVEYDGDDLFFGYTILNGDMINAEWGYISFSELRGVKVGFVEIDNDLHWTVVPAREVPLINCF